jgi:hypothetical protein
MRIVVQGMEENRRRKGGIPAMADRKQFLGNIKADPELKKILETSRQTR